MRALLAIPAIWFCACVSYHAIEPADLSESGRVRVTFTDGEQREVKESRLEADTVWGEFSSRAGRGSDLVFANPGEWAPAAVPLDSIAGLEERRFSTVKTIGWFAFMGVAVLGAVVFVNVITWD